MLVGMGTPNYVLPIAECSSREIDLMPTWRYARSYEKAIEIMSSTISGNFRPDIRLLITHRFSGLDKTEEAFAVAARPQDSAGNMVIKVALNA